ncbi:sugar transferase, PEP-CTERM/EpsH1 system associated [Anaerohalosphaera lusitana]|uniref:Sugar transferase, PEP-CTERM/EpsH1 system associated n=1 Tax=Anaerohalosphaera lusitana TaxID=1936003 RepID=A0A1U9NQ35_9BACT|nr:glycosyltransferase family 4 protein [Anaerohalosphaera lusitana]AQT69626.1 sugar transferase, PEP-CTERM/EpsH1 system associated [Anaerohalosphaera lusitana]
MTQKHIKIAALTAGKNTPSTRFRIRQYAERLESHGVTVEEHIPFFEKSCGLPSPFKAAARIPALFRSRSADLIWIGKELVQGYPTFEKLLKRPRVLDADDAIWLNFPLGRVAAPFIARNMDTVVAGNSYLADHFSQYNQNVHIVPTAIDLNRYTPRQIDTEPETFTIGWTGLACNNKYLDDIEQPLKEFLTAHQNTRLVVLSNKPWKHNSLPPDQVEFIRWTPENEATTLHRFSVGIMPLPDNKWTRGKCSFKMLQYMAAALPVIASPVGMNKDVFQKGEIGFPADTPKKWRQALEDLYKNWNAQKQMGQTGRLIIEQNYNADTIAAQLAKIFHTLTD